MKKCKNCQYFSLGEIKGSKVFYCIASPDSEEGNTLVKKDQISADEDGMSIYLPFAEDECVSLVQRSIYERPNQ